MRAPEDPSWDYANAPRCRSCRKLDKPMLDAELHGAMWGAGVGVVPGVVLVAVEQPPFFWDGVTWIFSAGMWTGLLFWGVVSLTIRFRYGRRPKPPEGWCRCGDGGGGDGGGD